ncbi:MAG: sodium:solute symporter family protein [FCB group bacterium]|nr:sodium:solute symporter family protein [FCB group bacterium]
MSQFSLLDGGIVGLYLLLTMAAGIGVRRYVGKVEQFLIAGREMNLYLGIASLAATEFGIVTCMYTAQSGYTYGFAGATPGIANALAMFLVGVTGFCVKPLRDAGVMTIPELFQNRYGSGIRWLSGVVIVLGGLLNMGVFLRVGGEFLLGVTGMAGGEYAVSEQAIQDAAPATAITAAAPEVAPKAAAPEGWVAAHKLELIMTALLIAVAVYTIMGGMLSVLVTDFLQFVVMSVGLIAVTILILYNVGWSTLVDTVYQHYGAGGFNPFVNQALGWDYIIFQMLLNTAAVLTWQTTIQRLLAAKDTRTGRQVYTRTSFFFVCRWLIPVTWGIAALAVLPAALTSSPEFNSLHAMPLFLSTAVPIGLMGLMVAAMLAADMSTDSSYMLTWASVIYNDILAPFRRKGEWSEKRGLLWSRTIVGLIGVFLLVYGLWYEMEGPVWDYLTLTGTIYLASMATLLVACCYWKDANNWGAGAAIFFGALIPVTFLVLEKQPATAVFMKETIGPHQSGIAAYVCAGLAMVIGSLLKVAVYERRRSAINFLIYALMTAVAIALSLGLGWVWLMAVVVAWYSTITVYVSIRGAYDIRGMLKRLREGNEP